MTQTNQNIRKAAAGAGVKLWQIADKLGYTDSYFSRLLRKELPEDKQAQMVLERNYFVQALEDCAPAVLGYGEEDGT